MKRNMLENHPKMEKQKKYCNFSAKMKLSFSKTKLSQSKNRGCEMSSIFELNNVKNEAILRDFLNFWT